LLERDIILGKQLIHFGQRSSGSVLSSYTYTLNADGIRTGLTEQQKESDGSTSTTTKAWTYDNLMRLTGEAVTSTISANSYTDTYSYDLVGNRLSKTDVVGTTTTVTNDSFNNNNQLTSETGTVNNVSSWSTSFQYDPEELASGRARLVPPAKGSLLCVLYDAVIVECPRFLIPLFSTSRGIDRLVAEGDPLPEFDVQAPLMGLPRLFKTTLEPVPATRATFDKDWLR
jgi:hypothetical protein